MLSKLLGKSFFQSILLAIALSCLWLSLTFPALAVTVQAVPNPRQVYGGWVTDMADLLPPEVEASLNQKISNLESLNGTEIAVVTVPNTAPSVSPKQFSTKLFNYWRIGKKGLDNGVLILISRDERRVEIETGYGIEAILSNAQVAKIIQSQILPQFNQGDFVGGTLAGTQALINILSEESSLWQKLIHLFHKLYRNHVVIGYGVMVLFSVFAIGFLAFEHIYKTIIPVEETVEPVGKSRTFINQPEQLNCTICKRRMEKLDLVSVRACLIDIQKKAQLLGSIRVDGWQCPNCQPQLSESGLHLRTYILDSDRFYLCPTCQEMTVEQTSKVLESATTTKEGKRRIIEQCHCCSYYKDWEETIPVKTFDSGISRSNDDSDSGNSWSAHGIDFGGGDSGGGGDGDSW